MDHRFKKHSKEFIEKRVAPLRGRKRPEHSKRMSGFNNPNYGKKHSLETRIKIGEKSKGRFPNKKTRMKMSLIHKGKPATRGMTGKKHSLETRNKIRESNINFPNRKFKDTSIELKMEQELKLRNINYKKQFPISTVGIVDFFLKELNLVIECDGCYYHGCPEHYPNFINKKDKNKTERLKNLGYNVFRFWEHDINRSIQKCVDNLLMK